MMARTWNFSEVIGFFSEVYDFCGHHKLSLQTDFVKFSKSIWKMGVASGSIPQKSSTPIYHFTKNPILFASRILENFLERLSNYPEKEMSEQTSSY